MHTYKIRVIRYDRLLVMLFFLLTMVTGCYHGTGPANEYQRIFIEDQSQSDLMLSNTDKYYQLIESEKDSMIMPDFKVGEWINWNDPHREDTTLIQKNIVEVVQFLRDYYQVPININSAHRSLKHQWTVNKGIDPSQSEHPKGAAVDISFLANSPNILAHFKIELETQGFLFKTLMYDFGINAIGIYSNRIHLASEIDKEGIHNYQGNSYAYWDNSKSLIKYYE